MLSSSTLAIQTPYQRQDAWGALSMPVYHSVAFEFEDAATMSDVFCGRVIAPDYSRVINPTVTCLEDKVKALTGAENVIALNSGMAAISATLFALAGQGKNIVCSRHLFGNTYQLIADMLPRFGVMAHICDLTNPAEVEQAVDEQTACLFVEIITNPQLEVADLRMLAKVCHRKGTCLVADTTMIPFTEFSAHALGVDIEVVSSTKYLSGGATSLGGLVIDYGTVADFGKRVKTDMLYCLGAYMTPHAAYMQTLGIETLAVRYQRQATSAHTIAQRLHDEAQGVKVNYIGLADNPYHDLATTQFGQTAGAMMTLELESQEACFQFINSLQLIKRATNLFDNRSLAIHPASTIFGPFTPERRREMDVRDTIIRLSIGLEEPDDILADILQAADIR